MMAHTEGTLATVVTWSLGGRKKSHEKYLHTKGKLKKIVDKMSRASNFHL